jgi:hypothetical protein
VDPQDPGYRRLRYVRYADLCRARHKSAYAEVRVMPICRADALVGWGWGLPPDLGHGVYAAWISVAGAVRMLLS